MTSAAPLFSMKAFAAPGEAEGAVAAAVDVAAELEAKILGPAEVGGGRLLSIWPTPEGPTFISVSARSIAPDAVWVRVTTQGLDAQRLDLGEEISATLEARLGTLGPGVRPPPRTFEYDRQATARLEGEIQDLLESMAAEPSAWEYLAGSIFERELLLQHLTELGA